MINFLCEPVDDVSTLDVMLMTMVLFFYVSNFMFHFYDANFDMSFQLKNVQQKTALHQWLQTYSNLVYKRMIEDHSLKKMSLLL